MAAVPFGGNLLYVHRDDNRLPCARGLYPDRRRPESCNSRPSRG